MKRAEDILVGLMVIVSTVIAMGIVGVGVYFVFNRISFVSLALIAAVIFLIGYTLKNIYIGLSIIINGRYEDEMTARENRRF